MPTIRPRHMVTESPELAAALDAAAVRWPGVSRSQLLVRLALEAADHEAAERVGRRAARSRVVRQHAGAGGPNSYPRGYLAEVRRDWPS